jgi:prevent-host-death family protein
MTRMTATEAARSFSSVLTRVSEGEEIELTRNGATVALIVPAPAKKRWVSATDLRNLIAALPPVDEDFITDLEDIRRESGPPPEVEWPS